MKKLLILIVLLALGAATYWGVQKAAKYSNSNLEKKVDKQVEATTGAIADTIPQ